MRSASPKFAKLAQCAENKYLMPIRKQQQKKTETHRFGFWVKYAALRLFHKKIIISTKRGYVSHNEKHNLFNF